MKKHIYFDRRAHKELRKLPKIVQQAFGILIEELQECGSLKAPDAKKIVGTELFEIRVKIRGAWRCFYAYLKVEQIIILSFFQKKSQKTPRRELEKALQRLRDHK